MIRSTSRLLELRCLTLCNRLSSSKVDSKYSDKQREKILETINNAESNNISRLKITKTRLKNLKNRLEHHGALGQLSDLESIEGFSKKTAEQLFDSIVNDNGEGSSINKPNAKIKGQVLNPFLPESVIGRIKTVLAVTVTAKSVCWTLINKPDYEVLEWHYHQIDYPDGKKFQLTDIYDISRRVTDQLPLSDICVMKAEATTLRAAGSDPNNPKMLSVNLQKAQMIAMIVALINATHHQDQAELEEDENKSNKDTFNQKVYFLRPTLPFRLYGTLIGNELVSTDQTIEILLQDVKEKSPVQSKFYISEDLKSMFRSRKELEKDMLGQCLLLALAFMDVCVYKNLDKINKLLDYKKQ